LTVFRLNVPYSKDLRDWPVIFHDARNSAVGFIPGRLRLSGTEDSKLRLSWPRQPEPALVQICDSLSMNAWSTLTTPIASTNGMNSILVQPTGDHGFYRLVYP